MGTVLNVVAGVSRISMEYHEGITSHTVQDLVSRLEGLGFRVKWRPNLVRPTLGLLYAYR